MTNLDTARPATWEEASASPSFETSCKPFGLAVPRDSTTPRFATLISLCRISGANNLGRVDSVLEYLGYDLVVSMLLNGFSFDTMADLVRNRVSRHSLRDTLTLGSGPLSADEVKDYIAAHGQLSVQHDIVLVLSHYGIATPERAAQLSDLHGLSGTLLDLFLHQSPDPAADADLIANFLTGHTPFSRLPTIENLVLAQQYGVTEVAQILDFVTAGSRFELFPCFAALGIDPATCYGPLRIADPSCLSFFYRAGHTDYQSLADAVTSLVERLSFSDPNPKGSTAWWIGDFFKDLQARLGNDLAWRVLAVCPGAHATLKAARRSKKLAEELAVLDDGILRCVLTLAEEAALADHKTPSVADYRGYIKTFS